MYYTDSHRNYDHYPAISAKQVDVANSNDISCNWNDLREQLLRQWDLISASELESTKHNRLAIGRLLHRKYGISIEMAVNYLKNFERTLPLIAA